MTLTIDITPDLEKQLRDVAAMRGMEPRDCIVQALRAYFDANSNNAPCLNAEESKLFDEINNGPAESDWRRYYELIEKRRAEQISVDELNELGSRSARIEELNNKRVECLVKLAKIRNTSITQLMDDLGVTPPPVI